MPVSERLSRTAVAAARARGSQARAHRVDRGDRGGRSERNEHSEHSERGERGERNARSDQPERVDRPERAATTDRSRVEVRRSKRRRRTVSAYRDGDRVVVLLPARMTRAEEHEWVDVMLERIAKQERRRHPSDDDLSARARQLSQRYLEGAAEPTSVRWVDNQAARWGSCTPSDGTVRLSSRLRGMPQWVVDYVLVHELVHLLEPGHTPRFWELVGHYPQTERARGFLEGVAAARALPVDADGYSCEGEAPTSAGQPGG